MSERDGVSCVGITNFTMAIKRTKKTATTTPTLSSGECWYLAGFLDGEGSIGLYYDRTNKSWVPRISLVQNHSKKVETLFRRWKAVFGGSFYIYRQKKGSGSNHIQYRLTSEQSIRYCLEAIAGKTVIKTKQIILLEEWLDSRSYTYRVHQTLKALKREEY